MNIDIRHMIFSSAVLALILTASCSRPDSGSRNPYPPLPPALSETIPKPPVTSTPLMWQPGHWDWNGSGYAWAPGLYVPAAGHGNLWMPGWWAKGASGWTWQPAHWTS